MWKQTKEETIIEAIKDEEQKLEKANVPRGVYRAFFNQYRESCNIDKVQYSTSWDAAEDAAEIQESLGNDAILKGFHIHQWTDVIQKLWKKKHPSIKWPSKQRSSFKWEYYSTNQYGTYLKRRGHNIMRSYTTLTATQVEWKQKVQINGYYYTSDSKKIYFHQTTTASSVTKKFSYSIGKLERRSNNWRYSTMLIGNGRKNEITEKKDRGDSMN